MCSKSSGRAIEELNRTVIEIESKYKNELGRLKKKYDGDFRELEIQVDTLGRANGEFSKANKALAARVKVRAWFRCFEPILENWKVRIYKLRASQ